MNISWSCYKLSHDRVTLFKTFRGTAQYYARQTINHAVQDKTSPATTVWLTTAL